MEQKPILKVSNLGVSFSQYTKGLRIPQSVNYLDPLQEVGKQVGISVTDKKKKESIVSNLFCKYSLGKRVENYYPFQLSGGMARKVLLSTALASSAKVIIADER